jgi:hypothetical protein
MSKRAYRPNKNPIGVDNSGVPIGRAMQRSKSKLQASTAKARSSVTTDFVETEYLQIDPELQLRINQIVRSIRELQQNRRGSDYLAGGHGSDIDSAE